MKVCPKCGEELVDEAVICVNCGCVVENNSEKIDDDETSTLAKIAYFLAIFITILGLILRIIYWD